MTRAEEIQAVLNALTITKGHGTIESTRDYCSVQLNEWVSLEHMRRISDVIGNDNIRVSVGDGNGDYRTVVKWQSCSPLPAYAGVQKDIQALRAELARTHDHFQARIDELVSRLK